MSTIKFLCASTDTPREKTVKKMKLEVPQPGMNEYRIFYNHRDVNVDTGVGDKRKVVSTPCADFVSVQADHEPTAAEWSTVLGENGFTAEQITAII